MQHSILYNMQQVSASISLTTKGGPTPRDPLSYGNWLSCMLGAECVWDLTLLK